jgi:hypothetical protein
MRTMILVMTILMVGCAAKNKETLKNECDVVLNQLIEKYNKSPDVVIDGAIGFKKGNCTHLYALKPDTDLQACVTGYSAICR